MRLFKTLVSGLLALLMMSLVAAPIAAQDVSDDASDFDGIDGLQRVYARTFTPDFLAMFEGATPAAEFPAWLVVTTMAMEFDSEDTASAAMDSVLEDLALDDLSDDADIQVEETTLDVDFEHAAQLTIIEEDGVTNNILFAATQDSNYIYAMFGIVSGGDPNPVAAAMLTTMPMPEPARAPSTRTAPHRAASGTSCRRWSRRRRRFPSSPRRRTRLRSRQRMPPRRHSAPRRFSHHQIPGSAITVPGVSVFLARPHLPCAMLPLG